VFDFLPYCLIPIIAALVGWSTNWVAIKLMFNPKHFVGYAPLNLGWQGVIPRKARKMARVVVHKGLTSLTSVSEVYAALDRSKLVEQFHKVMRLRLESYVQDVIQKIDPALWSQIPDPFKQHLYNTLDQQLPDIAKTIFDELETHIEDIFDLSTMVEDHLAEHKELLCQIFQEAGSKEFRFIIRSGGIFGFLFGCVQMLVWWSWPIWWVLPLFGFLVGYVTNVIALKLIFKPLNPISIGRYRLQGLFLKRQKEVAHVICRITTEEVITINHILKSILEGAEGERVRGLILRQIEVVLEKVIKESGFLMAGANETLITSDKQRKLTASAYETALDYLLSELEDNQAFSEGQASIIYQMLYDKLEGLSPAAFQDILRPAFQEDEFTLILIGAVLGGGVGVLQLVILFNEMLPL